MKTSDKCIFEVSTMTAYGTFKEHSSKQARKNKSTRHASAQVKSKWQHEFNVHHIHISMATIHVLQNELVFLGMDESCVVL